MTEARSFSYSNLFASNAPISTRSENPHAKYDFAVAYPDPDTLPLNELIDSLRTAIDREGRDLAYYPSPAGLPSLRCPSRWARTRSSAGSGYRCIR